MEEKRSYRRRGTPDLPVGTYISIAGKNMSRSKAITYHPEIEIALQVSGANTEEVAGNIHTYTAGTIRIHAGGTPHRRIDYSEDARVHTIVFSPEAICMPAGHFFQEGFVKPLADGTLEMPEQLLPGHPAYEKVHALLMQLEDCRIYETNYKQNRLFLLMGICLALMPHCRIVTFQSPLPEPKHEAVKRCMRYLHNMLTKKITLKELGDHCHLHPNYLSAIFKTHTGMSVFEYLTRIRVESAQRLLREDLPVSKVAELSGFPSECLLYRKFKEITGVTPITYRKQKHREE